MGDGRKLGGVLSGDQIHSALEFSLAIPERGQGAGADMLEAEG